MLVFIPRSLCALKRVAAKVEQSRYGAIQGIRIALASGMYRAEATDGRRAVVVQGMVPNEDPPWPGFKDLPDDACETVVLPKDLERACKLGQDSLQNRFGVFGIATMGNDVYLGLGSELVTARAVQGRYPNISQVIPQKQPLFTFSVDPKLLAETLVAMAELLPEEGRRVQCFYYGDGLPLGFCARNIDNGIMIDALVVPLANPKPTNKSEEDTETPEPVEVEDDEAMPQEDNGEDAEDPMEPATLPTAQAMDNQETKPAKKARKITAGGAS